MLLYIEAKEAAKREYENTGQTQIIIGRDRYNDMYRIQPVNDLALTLLPEEYKIGRAHV